MIKLLRNFLRQQKNNVLQVFGLGFLVIIMIIAFLALNFSNSYIYNQYMNEIAGGKFYQSTCFKKLENVQFFGKYDEERNNYGTFLENFNYYQNDNKINEDVIKKATFQLTKLDDKKHLYRFTFNDGDNKSKFYCGLGEKFASMTSHNYLDFKVNIPFNYPTVADHDVYVAKICKNVIDKYVYDEIDPITHNKNIINPENSTNFMMTSVETLNWYQTTQQKRTYSYTVHPVYTKQDLVDQAKLYQLMISGMLYQDIEWFRTIVVNDLLVTGKKFAFSQTEPQYLANKPIIIAHNGPSLTTSPLQDGEILIYQEFAKLNHLHLGQQYVIAGNTFTIRGFATSAIATYAGRYFIGTPDLKNSTVAFANSKTLATVQHDLKTFNNTVEDIFLLINPDTGAKTINNGWLYDYFHDRFRYSRYNSSKLYSYFFKNGVDFNNLVSPLNYTIQGYVPIEWSSLNILIQRIDLMNEIAGIFLVLIFGVTVVIINIITFKMIDQNKKLIGVLKATVYKSWQLSITLVIAIIVPLVLFAIIGVLVAIPISHFITTTYQTLLMLINFGWYFNLLTSLIVIIVPVFSLIIISFFIVLYLLRLKPLDLINNNQPKQKYFFHISVIFTFIKRFLIKKFSYRNKLAITTAMRSYGKLLLMSFTSFFAATLVFFALAASGLVNDMLGSQFAGVNYNYQNCYQFGDKTLNDNFINGNNQLMYQFDNVDHIKKGPSVYAELNQALDNIIAKPVQLPPQVINFRGRYIMGSEMLKLRQKVEPYLPSLPPPFKNFWTKNKVIIDYVTNDNGKSTRDLLLTFGLIPYDKNNEVPYTQLYLHNSYWLDVNQLNDDDYYDNTTNTLSPACFTNSSRSKTAYGVNAQTNTFLAPNLTNGDLINFSNLNLKDITFNANHYHDWQAKNFIETRNAIINKLGIINSNTSAVQFIPIATNSNYASGKVQHEATIGNAIVYPYYGLDHQQKYIIGIIYDNFDKLNPAVTLMPQQWINSILFGKQVDLLNNNSFANSKLSKLNDNEFRYHLPIISRTNDYLIDVTKLPEDNYLNVKEIVSAFQWMQDMGHFKEMMKTNQYSLNVVITFFGFFSVILALMIIMIITNISVRDNLILINILRSLGYTATEVSYNFFLIMIPVLVVSSLFSVFIVPILVGTLASKLTIFAKIIFPIIFRWWYFAIMVFVNLIIYGFSYVVTWKLNINNKQLMTLTK